MVELELAGRVFVFDDGVAEKLGRLSEQGWYLRSGYVAFQPRKADAAMYPSLKRDRIVSLGAIIHLLAFGKLPAKGLVCTQKNGDDSDFRVENLEWVSRSTSAYRALDPQVNPQGGIRQLPSGRYNARAYLDGKLRSVGTFDTRELAQAARAEAITKGVARTPAPPPHQKKAQPQTLDQLRGRVAELEAEVEHLGLLEKISDLEAELERLRSVLPS
ncbi:HNH endonuclease [Deinococcus aestuarii]|uniref:HNH endonuclease n=1 Tax=Deinococcus aestuarii TaxID=2774531 RepID=UPI001C0BC1F1|nr:HNH endonuclease [Deinococcus aestuarii]